MQHAERTSDVNSAQDDRGRTAEWPHQIPARGWWDVLWRSWAAIAEDRVLIIAAGATFYLLLALFPAITAFVSTYGFLASPEVVARHVAALVNLLPESGLEILEERLDSLAGQDPASLSVGFVFGILFAYWSANNGVKALFEALNVAYEEDEKRSFLRLNLTALAFTLGAMATGVVLVVTLGIVPAVMEMVYLGPFAEAVIGAARWVILVATTMTGIVLLYRFGPSRAPAKWRWISWGSTLATLVWIAASAGFSYYLKNFADYEAVYGSLGAIIGFMMWIWISVVILIVGAEINAQLEHQTTRDSTTGTPKPMGQRGAVMADTIGEAVDD